MSLPQLCRSSSSQSGVFDPDPQAEAGGKSLYTPPPFQEFLDTALETGHRVLQTGLRAPFPPDTQLLSVQHFGNLVVRNFEFHGVLGSRNGNFRRLQVSYVCDFGPGLLPKPTSAAPMDAPHTPSSVSASQKHSEDAHDFKNVQGEAGGSRSAPVRLRSCSDSEDSENNITTASVRTSTSSSSNTQVTSIPLHPSEPVQIPGFPSIASILDVSACLYPDSERILTRQQLDSDSHQEPLAAEDTSRDKLYACALHTSDTLVVVSLPHTLSSPASSPYLETLDESLDEILEASSLEAPGELDSLSPTPVPSDDSQSEDQDPDSEYELTSIDEDSQHLPGQPQEHDSVDSSSTAVEEGEPLSQPPDPGLGTIPEEKKSPNVSRSNSIWGSVWRRFVGGGGRSAKDGTKNSTTKTKRGSPPQSQNPATSSDRRPSIDDPPSTRQTSFTKNRGRALTLFHSSEASEVVDRVQKQQQQMELLRDYQLQHRNVYRRRLADSRVLVGLSRLRAQFLVAVIGAEPRFDDMAEAMIAAFPTDADVLQYLLHETIGGCLATNFQTQTDFNPFASLVRRTRGSNPPVRLFGPGGGESGSSRRPLFLATPCDVDSCGRMAVCFEEAQPEGPPDAPTQPLSPSPSHRSSHSTHGSDQLNLQYSLSSPRPQSRSQARTHVSILPFAPLPAHSASSLQLPGTASPVAKATAAVAAASSFSPLVASGRLIPLCLVHCTPEQRPPSAFVPRPEADSISGNFSADETAAPPSEEQSEVQATADETVSTEESTKEEKVSPHHAVLGIHRSSSSKKKQKQKKKKKKDKVKAKAKAKKSPAEAGGSDPAQKPETSTSSVRREASPESRPRSGTIDMDHHNQLAAWVRSRQFLECLHDVMAGEDELARSVAFKVFWLVMRSMANVAVTSMLMTDFTAAYFSGGRCSLTIQRSLLSVLLLSSVELRAQVGDESMEANFYQEVKHPECWPAILISLRSSDWPIRCWALKELTTVTHNNLAAVHSFVTSFDNINGGWQFSLLELLSDLPHIPSMGVAERQSSLKGPENTQVRQITAYVFHLFTVVCHEFFLSSAADFDALLRQITDSVIEFAGLTPVARLVIRSITTSLLNKLVANVHRFSTVEVEPTRPEYHNLLKLSGFVRHLVFICGSSWAEVDPDASEGMSSGDGGFGRKAFASGEGRGPARYSQEARGAHRRWFSNAESEPVANRHPRHHHHHVDAETSPSSFSLRRHSGCLDGGESPHLPHSLGQDSSLEPIYRSPSPPFGEAGDSQAAAGPSSLQTLSPNFSHGSFPPSNNPAHHQRSPSSPILGLRGAPNPAGDLPSTQEHPSATGTAVQGETPPTGDSRLLSSSSSSESRLSGVSASFSQFSFAPNSWATSASDSPQAHTVSFTRSQFPRQASFRLQMCDLDMVQRMCDLFRALRLDQLDPTLVPDLTSSEKSFLNSALNLYRFWDDTLVLFVLLRKFRAQVEQPEAAEHRLLLSFLRAKTQEARQALLKPHQP